MSNSTPSSPQDGRTPKVVPISESSDGKAAHNAIRYVNEDSSAPVTDATRQRAKEGAGQLGGLAASGDQYLAVQPYALPVDSGQMAVISTSLIRPEKMAEIIKNDAGAIIDIEGDRVEIYVKRNDSRNSAASISIGPSDDSTDNVGEVYAPTGQVVVCDPCYAFDDQFHGTDAPATGGHYDALCRVSLTDGYGTMKSGPDNGAVVASTLYGDGLYDVSYLYGGSYRSATMKVTFEDVWDEDDEEESEEAQYWEDEDNEDD